jgi:hypothetical protein
MERNKDKDKFIKKDASAERKALTEKTIRKLKCINSSGGSE